MSSGRRAPKATADSIAHTALGLLDEVGLDGLTMRLVAKELGVQVAALYWHIKNKQQLLDAMATIMAAEATEGVEPPGPGAEWSGWMAGWARRLRGALLAHRDGARVFGGSNTAHPAVYRACELTLRVLLDAGFPLAEAARSLPVVLDYAVGFVIEEQAREGLAYGGPEAGPYLPDRLAGGVDADRYPLLARAHREIFAPDADAAFEHGLRLILAGMAATGLPTA